MNERTGLDRVTGRPSIRTAAIVEAICLRLAEGEPLAWICREPGMPSVRTVWDWEDDDPDLSASITRAREIGGDAIAAEAMRIADTPIEAFKEETDADGKVTKRTRSDAVDHRRLQVETRLKLLAKWHPKRYGDKIDVTSDGGALSRQPISEFEMCTRLSAIFGAAKARQEAAEAAEFKPRALLSAPE